MCKRVKGSGSLSDSLIWKVAEGGEQGGSCNTVSLKENQHPPEAIKVFSCYGRSPLVVRYNDIMEYTTNGRTALKFRRNANLMRRQMEKDDNQIRELQDHDARREIKWARSISQARHDGRMESRRGGRKVVVRAGHLFTESRR